MVEHPLGKGEVESSILSGSTIIPVLRSRCRTTRELLQRRHRLDGRGGAVLSVDERANGEDGGGDVMLEVSWTLQA